MLLSKIELEKILDSIGISILNTSFSSKAGHIGGSLSLVQLLTYYLHSLKNSEVEWRIILSKGHSSLGLYSLFEHLEIEKNLTSSYCSIPGGFHGHTCSKASKYILASTGSLGHGLPLAAGYAYANFKKGNTIDTICIIGDGDLQEGSNLEILHSLGRLRDCNLKILHDSNASVDSNFISANEFFMNITSLYSDNEFIKSFEMFSFLQHQKMREWLSLPGLRIANCITTKAFGFPQMYNNPRWHAGIPSNQELKNMSENSDFSLIP